MTGNAPPLDEAAFLEQYGAAELPFNGSSIPLATWVRFEDRFCKADPEARQDDATRVRFLAKQVGADALAPEHQYLLEQTEAPKA